MVPLTTLPAAITELSPIIVPGRITQPAPVQTFRPISTPHRSSSHPVWKRTCPGPHLVIGGYDDIVHCPTPLPSPIRMVPPAARISAPSAMIDPLPKMSLTRDAALGRPVINEDLDIWADPDVLLDLERVRRHRSHNPDDGRMGFHRWVARSDAVREDGHDARFRRGLKRAFSGHSNSRCTSFP